MLTSSVNILPKMKVRLFLALLLLCCIQAIRGQQPSTLATVPLLKDPTVSDFRCSLGLSTVVCGAVLQNRTALAIIMNLTSNEITTIQLSTDANPVIRVSTTTGGNSVCFGMIETNNFRIQHLNLTSLGFAFDYQPITPDNYTEFTVRGGNNACHVLLATDDQIFYRRWDKSESQPLVFGNAYDYVVGPGTMFSLAAYLTSPYQAFGCWRDSSDASANAFCAVFTDGSSSITPIQIGVSGVASIQAMVLANPEQSVVIYGQQSDLRPTLFKTTGSDPRDLSQNSTTTFGFSTSVQAGAVAPNLLSVAYLFPNLLTVSMYDPSNLASAVVQPVNVLNNLTNVLDVRYTTMTPAFSSPYSFVSYWDTSLSQYTGIILRNFYCGDGVVTGSEQCDGGFRCVSCQCPLGFNSTVPLSVDCQAQPNQGRNSTGVTNPVDGNPRLVSCAVNANITRDTFACIVKTESSSMVDLLVFNMTTNEVLANYTLANITSSVNYLLVKSMLNSNWVAQIPLNTSALLMLVIDGTTSEVIQQDITTNLSTSSGMDMLVYHDNSIGIFFYRSNSLYYKRYKSTLELYNAAMELALTSIDFDVVYSFAESKKASFLLMNQDPQAFTVTQYLLAGSNRVDIITQPNPLAGTATIPNLVYLETHLLTYFRVVNGGSTSINLMVYNASTFAYLANYTYDSTYFGTILDIASLAGDTSAFYDQTGFGQIVQFFNGLAQPVGGIFPWDPQTAGANNFTAIASTANKQSFVTYWQVSYSLYTQSSTVAANITSPPIDSPVAGPVDPASPTTPSAGPSDPSPSIPSVAVTPSSAPTTPGPGELPGWTIALIVILVALVVGSGIFLAIFFIQRDRRKRKKKRDSVNMSPTLPKRLSVNVTADESHYMAINSPHSADKSHHSTSKSSSGTGIDLNGAYDPNNRWEINPREITISEKLGGGAFGVIYKGRWKYTVVAIKSTNIDSDQAFEELKKEALLMTSVRPHPNILPIFGYYREGEKFNLVMEFQGGGNLYQMLKSDPTNSAFSGSRLINLVHGIASGLEMLHSMNIVHRDIAARNILMSDSGVPKVSDFGMARAIGENKAGITTSNIGPIAWMAPESLRSQLYSDKTDVWAFGVLLWEIVAKKDPFAGTQLIDLAIKIREGLTLPIPDDCPEVFRRIMNQCWEFSPEDRPSMSVILAELDEYKTVTIK